MKTRVTTYWSVLAIAVLAILFSGATSPAADDQPATTEDIVYMEDGRELHGQILEEAPGVIVFEFVDRATGMRATLTLNRENIVKIDRDVPVEGGTEEEEPEAEQAQASSSASKKDGESWIDQFESVGHRDDPSLPGVYVIPMKGQMGTDVHKSIFEKVTENIKEVGPDVVVWMLNCSDVEESIFRQADPRERGLFLVEEYVEMVNLFKDDPDMRRIRQVMWVEDSVGVSSLIAMAWPELYVKPSGHLGGLNQVMLQSGAGGWADEDVRAKMTAAWVGMANSFLEYGGYPINLGKAMILADKTLSATWKGRVVEWRLDKSGEYLVDASDNQTANFSAKEAEDFCVSKGTAETIDDLMLLLGYREFRLIDGQAPEIVEDYIEDWRRALDRSRETWTDYNVHIGRAGGEETIRWLGRAKRDLEEIIAAMDRYEAVMIRWGGPSVRFEFQTWVEQLTEQIRGLRRGSGGGRGPGGGGGRGPGGGGGGPGRG